MKTETRKLAGIATVVCGGMASLGAGAVESHAPATTDGPIAQQDGTAAAAFMPAEFVSEGETQIELEAISAAALNSGDVMQVANSTFVDETLPVADAVPPEGTRADADASVARESIAPVSYAAPIAVPARTDKNADMQTEPAVKALTAAPAKEPDEAMKVVQPVHPVLLPAPAVRRSDTARTGETTQRAEAASVPEAARAAQVLEPVTQAVVAVHRADTAPLAHIARSSNRAPVSYAAPLAVPVRIDASVQTKHLDGATVAAETRPSGFANPGAESKRGANAQPLAAAPRDAAALQQAKAQAKAPLSYAAPIVVPPSAVASASPHPQAAAGKDDPNWPPANTVALSEERLDSMRGGFDMPSGLKVSFGITRTVAVNGNLVTTTSFNIPDINNITAQQAQSLATVNAGALLQNGPNNVVQQGALPSLSGSVIQNTLNNQNIQALTTINATVNSLSMFKSINVGSTLNNALLSAVRGR
ncbi:MAG TPA: hypothetical protein VGL08_01890 [Paraburkholderia sp.]|jgi:hypothetical protein